MNLYPAVKQWFLSPGALEASFADMARDGRSNREGVCMWLGRREDGGNAYVTHVGLFAPDSIRKGPGHLHIPSNLMLDLHEKADAENVILVGQIHSHPKIAGTNLSYTDKAYGVSVPGYLSVVAPNFSLDPDVSIERCGVHVFVEGQGFQRLTKDEALRRIIVDAALNFSTIKIGNG